ncbi:tyrosine-type recombinase/integrase [Planktomarina sp.]|nr:tyrosine-type recombinase/integrase [Planktomarina sp.]
MRDVSLKNYLKQSGKRGVYSFRRGIPIKLRPYFKKADGSLRGREWKEPTKTTNLSSALVLAARINQQFEYTKSLAELELGSATQSLSQREQTDRFINYIKKEGIHPDYAPSVLAPKEEQQAWINLKKRRDIIGDLEEFKVIFVDQVGEDTDHGGATYKPQPMYYQVQEQIDFIKGKSTSIKNRLRPTWRSAYEEYVHDKIDDGRKLPDAETKSKLARASRVAEAFASFVGLNNAEVGWNTFLVDIRRDEAKRYLGKQLNDQERAGSTVGREITTLSAIYNHAVTEHKRDEPSLSKESNPFSKLRDQANAKHEEALRLGDRENKAARPWTPQEYTAFKERLPKMNEQARLVALISLHTGARLKDTTGLMLDDVVLEDEHNSLIDYRHNKNRKISKDSIERIVPIYGELLEAIKAYKAKYVEQEQQSFFTRYCGSRRSDSASNLLNQRHLDTINKDPTLKMHGLRNTLQSKFDAALLPNSISGYLIGWRDRTTIGMQVAYKSGYPHEQMLKYMKQGHDITDWALRR